MRRFEIVEHSIYKAPTKTLMLNPFFPSFPIDDDEIELLNFTPSPFFFDEFETVTDLIQIRTRRVKPGSELYIQKLSDRVADLELGFERLLKEEKKKKKEKTKKSVVGERKYTWTTEIKSPEKDRKFKWTAEIDDDEKKSYKWTAEIKGKGGDHSRPPTERTYTIEVSSGGKKKKKCEKEGKKAKAVEPTAARVVEIEEEPNAANHHGAIVLRQTFAKRVAKRRGKKKELSPQDAAALIQMSFRAYLIRRSQALRALRELAIAKSKLKELRALFNNFTYRRRLARDAAERQRFSEKIIVLLLTVDAIEGADVMVRASKKSMVDELEAMLDVVDPQPHGKSLSMRRRTFDMPDGAINKEIAEGVAQVVRLLGEEEDADSETFEASV